MSALFRNRFVIGSKRYRGYDYTSPGRYFITICTNNKFPYFGKIENRVMVLSDLGQILHNEWLKTPDIRPDMNITLDEFVIMPDHFHAIIIIGENRYNQNNNPANRRNATHGGRNAMHGVSTTKPITFNNLQNEFGPQTKNLSSIIRGIKSVVTVYAKKTKQDFQWQSRYHDHIIRSNPELQRIRKYIIENPKH